MNEYIFNTLFHTWMKKRVKDKWYFVGDERECFYYSLYNTYLHPMTIASHEKWIHARSKFPTNFLYLKQDYTQIILR